MPPVQTSWWMVVVNAVADAEPQIVHHLGDLGRQLCAQVSTRQFGAVELLLQSANGRANRVFEFPGIPLLLVLQDSRARPLANGQSRAHAGLMQSLAAAVQQVKARPAPVLGIVLEPSLPVPHLLVRDHSGQWQPLARDDSAGRARG
jgi:hypothetical protein